MEISLIQKLDSTLTSNVLKSHLPSLKDITEPLKSLPFFTSL